MIGLPLYDSLLALLGSWVLVQMASNGMLSNPWFYAAVSAIALWVGGAIGDWIQPDQRWQAGLLAVGGGALIISMAFELYNPAVKNIGKWGASGYFLIGVGTFGGLDILIDRVSSDESEERGWDGRTHRFTPPNFILHIPRKAVNHHTLLAFHPYYQNTKLHLGLV